MSCKQETASNRRRSFAHTHNFANVCWTDAFGKHRLIKLLITFSQSPTVSTEMLMCDFIAVYPFQALVPPVEAEGLKVSLE